MVVTFGFEGDEVAALTWMPFSLRRRLDLAGLHVSLAAWQALDLDTRRAWCEHPDDAASFARFAEVVRARCESVGHPAEPCDVALPTWNEPDAARAVWARAESLGHPVAADLDRWRALSDDARYALCRLCEGRRREDRFVAALRELSL